MTLTTTISMTMTTSMSRIASPQLYVKHLHSLYLQSWRSTNRTQDELAETSVPSPPAYDKIDDDYEGYDYYDYWMDLEYGTDEYYDVVVGAKNDPRAKPSQKRKLQDASASARPGKKLRTESKALPVVAPPSDTIWQGVPVIYKPVGEIHDLQSMHCKRCDKSIPCALLPDWRQRYPQTQHRGSRSDKTENDGQQEQIEQDEPEEDWEDECQGEEDRTAQLDPGVLMSILQSKLAEGGVGGGGEELQAMLAKMLSEGGGTMEDILESLTASVLEQVDEGGAESGMGKWLSQQGVKIQEQEEDEEDENEEYEEYEDGMGAAAETVASPNGAAPKSKLTNGTTTMPPATATAPSQAMNSTAETGTRRQRKQKPVAKPTSADAQSEEAKPVAQPTSTDDQSEEAKPAAATKSTTTKSTARGTKRKAGEEASDEKLKKQSRGYAASAKSSQSRADSTEKRTTRSSRQRK